MCDSNNGLGDAVEYAAGNLPAGWGVEVHIEEGAAWVRLEGPEGNGVFFDAAGMTLAQEVMHATKVCGG